MKQNELRDQITADLKERIEQGKAPWQKPWDKDKAGQAFSIPRNATTGKAYRGMNAINLMMKGHEDPRWCTYKQAQEQGWQVRKGSKSAVIEYWKFEETKTVTNQATGKKEKKTVKLDKPRAFRANVFHASQIDGIPAYEPAPSPFSEKRVEAVLDNSGARIFHDQLDRAYYHPGQDQIHLPPKQAFSEPQKYYAVALHELGHWTGHSDRLDCDLSGKFGSESYAKEELRAEMCSVFVNAELGVEFHEKHYEQHAAHLQHWLKVLEDEPNAFFNAARDAQKAADYVLEFEHERAVGHDKDQRDAEKDKDKDFER